MLQHGKNKEYKDNNYGSQKQHLSQHLLTSQRIEIVIIHLRKHLC